MRCWQGSPVAIFINARNSRDTMGVGYARGRYCKFNWCVDSDSLLSKAVVFVPFLLLSATSSKQQAFTFSLSVYVLLCCFVACSSGLLFFLCSFVGCSPLCFFFFFFPCCALWFIQPSLCAPCAVLCCWVLSCGI